MSLPGGAVGYMTSAFLSILIFGLSLTQLHEMALTLRQGPFNPGRRWFVQRAALLGLLAAVGVSAIRVIARGASALSPSSVSHEQGKLPPEVTPNDQFYEVSKNMINPQVELATWKLDVVGDFQTPLSLTYHDLLAMPWKEEYVTLTCISNPIGGGLISNALGRGVPLKALLERAGWRVVEVWEHEVGIKGARIAAQVLSVLARPT